MKESFVEMKVQEEMKVLKNELEMSVAPMIFRNFFFLWYKMKVKYTLASTMISSWIRCFFFDAIIFDGTGTLVIL